MKKITLLLAFALGTKILFGQVSQQEIVMYPPSPTEQDTIYMYVSLVFAQDGCKLEEKSLTENGSTLNATAKHCVGVANSFCEIVDTFVLNPRPAGTYLFTTDIQSYKTQCQFLFPYPSYDTLSFTVYDWGVGIEKPVLEVFSLYPNPATTHLTLEKVGAVKQGSVHACVIYDAVGRAIRKEEIIAFPTQIKIADLPAGIYWLQLTEDADFHSLPFIKE